LTGALTSGGTVSLDSSSTILASGSSSINSGYTIGILHVTSGVSATSSPLSLTGLQIDSGATFNTGTSLITSSCAGSGTYINGTFTGTTGGLTLTGSGCVLDGVGTISPSIGIVTLTGDKTIPSTASLTITRPIALSASTTVTNQGAVVSTNNSAITGANGTSSVWTNAAGSTLYFSGSGAGLLSTGVLNASATGNIVQYTALADQTVKVPATSYYNLMVSGSGIKTIGSGLTVTNNLTIATGPTVDLTGATTANQLILGNTRSRKKSYGSSSSSAAFVDNTLFSGAGTITPTTGRIIRASGDIDTTSDTSTSSGSTRNSSSQTASTPPVTITATSNTPALVITPVSVTPPVSTSVEVCTTPGALFSSITGKPCANVTVSTPSMNTYNFGTITLRIGSRGDSVRSLQMFLNAKLNAGLTVDGSFGKMTAASVKAWQAANGLAADGIVGFNTKAKMSH
jgi:hypothetical protein